MQKLIVASWVVAGTALGWVVIALGVCNLYVSEMAKANRAAQARLAGPQDPDVFFEAVPDDGE